MLDKRPSGAADNDEGAVLLGSIMIIWCDHGWSLGGVVAESMKAAESLFLMVFAAESFHIPF